MFFTRWRNEKNYARLLIASNVLIILAVETAAGGEYFVRSGIIHLLEIFFVLLLIRSILAFYPFGDAAIRPMLTLRLHATLVLGLAHVVEFAMISWDPVGLANTDTFVVLCYLFWAVLNVLGTEKVLDLYYQKDKSGIRLLQALAALIFVLLIALLANPYLALGVSVSLAIVAFLLVFIWLMLTGLMTIGKIFPFMSGCPRLYSWSAFLVLLAAFFEFIEPNLMRFAFLNISLTQVTNLAHFAIIAAMSVGILAFERLKIHSGLYLEVQR